MMVIEFPTPPRFSETKRGLVSFDDGDALALTFAYTAVSRLENGRMVPPMLTCQPSVPSVTLPKLRW